MNKDEQAAQPRQFFLAYGGYALILFSSYVYLYQYALLEETINNAALNTLTSLSALIVAIFATMIYQHYQPDDFPRKIWLYMMLGAWLWFYAESAWGVIAYFQGEVQSPSIADTGWVGAFVLFTIAFYHQYSIIFTDKKKQIISVAIAVWALAVFLPMILLAALGQYTAESHINYYYPIADLALGLAGIALAFVFQGAALARPWIGLVVFAISDLFYAWAEQTGLYTWSAENSNFLTLAIDSSYLAAYLIVGFGFLGHWILLNYGFRGKK